MSSATAPGANNSANEITVIPPSDIEMSTNPRTVQDTKINDPFLVAFVEPYDATNPKDWPTGRKWAVTDVLSATGFNRIMVSTIMAPALSTIAKEFDMSPTESAMALSIYLLATAFGPLFIGPLSEIYGRETILHVSNVWFLVWNIVCGFATSGQVLIASRFLAGFGASSIYALAGGVLGDVWRPEQRGKALGFYLLIPLLGVAVGPIIGGFMAYRTTWRWMFWSTSIFQAVMILVCFPTFHETYAPVILSRRARKLRKLTGDSRYYTLHERTESQQSLITRIGMAVSRPFRLLAFHPIIQIVGIIQAFQYGVLYIVLSSFSDLWTKQYGHSVQLSGLHYISCALGELAGSQLGGPLMDYLYRRIRSGDPEYVARPESRIILMFLGSALVPIGLLIYGWTAQFHVHWMAVDIGAFIYMFGGQIAGMPLNAYIIDTYTEHTSSAMAASQFLRSLTAFLFPLFVPTMYEAMGYGWGNSCIALAALVILLPAPLVLMKWGEWLRSRMAASY